MRILRADAGMRGRCVTVPLVFIYLSPRAIALIVGILALLVLVIVK